MTVSKNSYHANRNVMHNTVSNSWYTPHNIINSVKKVLGSIDIDPASNDFANTWIQAATYYTEETNGLDKPWIGKVWLNPPYGRIGITSSTEIWINKFIEEYNAGNMTEGIAIFNAMVDKKWLWRTVDKFPFFIMSKGHFSFIPGHDNKSSHNIYASIFVYLGPNEDDFIAEFRQYGAVLRQE